MCKSGRYLEAGESLFVLKGLDFPLAGGSGQVEGFGSGDGAFAGGLRPAGLRELSVGSCREGRRGESGVRKLIVDQRSCGKNKEKKHRKKEIKVLKPVFFLS